MPVVKGLRPHKLAYKWVKDLLPRASCDFKITYILVYTIEL